MQLGTSETIAEAHPLKEVLEALSGRELSLGSQMERIGPTTG